MKPITPSLVVIPCWQRPAHLAALLKTITQARGWQRNSYLFSVDRDHAPAITDVISDFLEAAAATTVDVTYRSHRFDGLSCNFLEAYVEALALAHEQQLPYVITLEEDLLVASDVFEYFSDAFELSWTNRTCVLAHPIAVSACLNQSSDWNASGSQQRLGVEVAWSRRAGRYRENIVYAAKAYQSIGTAHSVAFLELICQHAVADYYADPAGYITKHFPASKLQPQQHQQQCGLIQRIMEVTSSARVVYPLTPRACHVGWYGVNRTEGKTLDTIGCTTWREGRDVILTMTSDHMNELADPRFRDIARCGLIRDRVSLKLV